ncbi:MAG: DUF3798 domain-containing protein [Defluviitaleaceae bacterium]|nr:DUF3798 domain-containing protein [Defluviitaleaceae bacterium]
MKKKILGLIMLAAVVFALAACGGGNGDDAVTGASDDADWVIGIITGTVSQGEEEYLAAARMQERFGSDRIVRATYPDAFGAEMETTIAQVQWLVDQGARAIVFVQAVPGTIPAIQLVRETVDENILLFAGTVHDPPRDIAQHADIAVISDDLNVGPHIVRQGNAMGAEIMAHISFPRHLGMENIAVRRERMMAEAEALGMEWLEVTAPDPTTEGLATTQMFILEEIPRIIEEHGDRVAFFSTNCGMQEPLITQIINYGGFYPLQCCPSPFHALPAALNIDMGGREGDVQFVLEQTAAAVTAQGGSGRISTWPVPINMLLIEAGVLYSIEYLEGNLSGRHDRAALTRIFNNVAQGFGGGGVELANWIDDQGTIDNFYLLMSSFVTF